MQVKVLILTTDGINCNKEMARAFELAGAVSEEVHLNELLENKRNLNEFDILAFPGGFSYGDDIKSGKILSLHFLKLKADLEKFTADKKLIIGICNGFQFLTSLGLIPENTPGVPSVSLYWNESGHFECRWVDIKISKTVNSPWLTGLQGKTLKIQSAHAEGRLLTPTPEAFNQLFKDNLAVAQYVDEAGYPTEEYPFNPNGSALGLAGLVDRSGLILGMMPHPERNVEPHHHPNHRRMGEDHVPDGLQIFINAVEYSKTRKN